jgi:hypothetical protein
MAGAKIIGDTQVPSISQRTCGRCFGTARQRAWNQFVYNRSRVKDVRAIASSRRTSSAFRFQCSPEVQSPL